MNGFEWFDEDGKKHFQPIHDLITCFRCGRRKAECSVRTCPKTGANMCISCCKRCRFSVKVKYSSALGCGYGK